MLKWLALAVVVSGCHGEPAARPWPGVPGAPPLLGAVGPSPRVYASVSLAHPAVRDQLDALVVIMRETLRKSPRLCGIDVNRLDQLRIAIGEPLRIAAEIDGRISMEIVTCMIGERGVQALADRGIIVRDRPGGIAIERDADRHHAAAASGLGAELASRCTAASCGVARLATPARPLWLTIAIDDKLRVRLSGPELGGAPAAVAAAVARLTGSLPALRGLSVRDDGGALVVEAEDLLDHATELALRDQLGDALILSSSSMVPTLARGDRVLVAKGPFRRALVPGDVIAYRHEGELEIKRYLAAPGQRVTETARGLAIDGAAPATEVIDPGFRFRDDDGHAHRDIAGAIVREHLGDRSYLTLRTGPPITPGSWVVPEGRRFVVGDNRNNSNDSRYGSAIPDDEILGLVVAVWYASRDGVPDWDRIGIPIE